MRKIFMLATVLLVGWVTLLSYNLLANTEPLPPVKSERNFRQAKNELHKIYRNDRTTFYCGCTYNEHKQIDLNSCGYRPRVNATRAKRLEWEHIVPASYFGNNLPCWKEGGREGCGRNSAAFRNFEGDMHNLVPEIGELNGDRSNKIHDELPHAKSLYGACYFIITKDRAMPRKAVRGDVARIWLYMSHKYGMEIDPTVRKTYERWNLEDPVDDRELWRNREIKRVQGDSNIFIEP